MNKLYNENDMSQSAMDEIFEICFITKMKQYTRSKYILRYTLLNIEYILITLLSQCSNFYVSHLSSMFNKKKHVDNPQALLQQNFILNVN